MTRKRSAATDAERLEEETAQTDADNRIALKRKAENDPIDSEVEDSAVYSLAELWHREDDPETPRHLSHTMNVVGITLTTRVASCSTTHLSRRQELRKFGSFVNFVSGRWLTDPRDEVVFGTRWVDINKGDEH